jgi:hypothetical protein
MPGFKFTKTDKTVRAYLSATEIGQVRKWQDYEDDWSFEFHNGHTTGRPLYVRAKSDYSSENLPKIDTIEHTASDYTNINCITNYMKLVNYLDSKAKKDVMAVVQQSWDSLVILVNNHYESKTVTAAPAPVAVVAAASQTKSCSTTGCNGTVPIVKQGKAPCSACYRYQ